MKRFFLVMLIASVLFFIAYLIGFYPPTFYALSIFTAGLLIYNLPVIVFKNKNDAHLRDVIKLQEERLEIFRSNGLFLINRCRQLQNEIKEYKSVLNNLTIDQKVKMLRKLDVKEWEMKAFDSSVDKSNKEV